MRFSSLYLSAILITFWIYAPGQSVPPGAPLPRMERPPDVQLPIIGAQARTGVESLDPAELTKEARELMQLAQSIPLDIEHVNRGVLSKDVAEKLKRIEKLSKHLRSQIYR